MTRKQYSPRTCFGCAGCKPPQTLEKSRGWTI